MIPLGTHHSTTQTQGTVVFFGKTSMANPTATNAYTDTKRPMQTTGSVGVDMMLMVSGETGEKLVGET